MSKQPPGSYPRQGAYPTQPMAGYPQQHYPTRQPPPGYMYPQQPGQPPVGYPQQPMGRAPPQPAYGVPPPPYSAVGQPTAYSQAGPQPTYPTQMTAQQPAMYPGYYPRMAVPMHQGTFDAGARFGPGTGATTNVPPPPPGHMPNAAQMAAAHGQPVGMRQQNESWISGGSDGGYTVW